MNIHAVALLTEGHFTEEHSNARIKKELDVGMKILHINRSYYAPLGVEIEKILPIFALLTSNHSIADEESSKICEALIDSKAAYTLYCGTGYYKMGDISFEWNTLLHLAAKMNRIQTIRILLNNEMLSRCVNQQNSERKLPSECCADAEVRDLLKEREKCVIC
jgi:hypothetical protein